MLRNNGHKFFYSFISSIITTMTLLLVGTLVQRTAAQQPVRRSVVSAQATTTLPTPPVRFMKAAVYDSGGMGAVSVAAGDVNVDGHPDVIVDNLCGYPYCEGVGGSGQIDMLLNNGDGTFQAPIGYSTGANLATSLVLGGGLMFVTDLCLDPDCNLDGAVSMMAYHGGVNLIGVYDSGDGVRKRSRLATWTGMASLTWLWRTTGVQPVLPLS